MPAIPASQMKKIEQALATACAGAGPIGRWDASTAALDAAEKELALREIGRRYRKVDERVARLEEMARAVRDLKEAAAYRAVVLGVHWTNGERPPAARVHLALLGQQTRLVAGVLPDVDVNGLAAGDEVEVVQTGPQHYGIRGVVGTHHHHGPLARIEAVLGGNLLRAGHGPEALALLAAGEVARAIAAAGDDLRPLIGRWVSYDPQLGLAFDLVGEPEQASFVVREFPHVALADVVLRPETARLLERKLLLPFRHPELARAHGVRQPRFVILSGPAGVGKTEYARALATELGRPLYLISGAEVADQWYGNTEAKLRARFEAARQEPAGAIMVWDEAESLLVERGRSLVGVEDRVVAFLLSVTDGFRGQDDGVLWVLTTNRADKIDAALRRALRATVIEFDRPDPPRTRALFRRYLRDVVCLDATAEELARLGVIAVFAEREPLAAAVLRDGTRLPLTRPMAISGALVHASCQTARELSLARAARDSGPPGITRAEFLAGIAEQFAAVAQSLATDNVANVLSLPPGQAGQIVALEARGGDDPQRWLAG